MTQATRLHDQVRRLYLLGEETPAAADTSMQVRALMLGVRAPADWALLSRVWHGAQADLALPAPAIAVDGRRGCELWFSLVEPLAAAAGTELLQALRLRYLPDLPTARVASWPPQAWPSEAARLAPPLMDALPGQATGPDRWSAFIAPDLAPVFGAEPWLDVPPGEAGQAELLARLHSIPPDALDDIRAMLLPALTPPVGPTSARPSWAGRPPGASSHHASSFDALAIPAATADPVTARADSPSVPSAAATEDACRFLQGVMHDPGVPLALRIDAAKALLAHAAGSPGRPNLSGFQGQGQGCGNVQGTPTVSRL